MKLRRMMLLLFSLFAGVPVLFVSTMLFSAACSRSNESATDLLLTVAAQERRALERTFDEYLSDAQLLAISPAVQQATKELTANRSAQSESINSARKLLSSWADRLSTVQQFIVCDTNYTVLLSSDADLEGTHYPVEPLHRKKLAEGQVIATCLQDGHEDEGVNSFLVATPMYEDSGERVLAYLLLSVDTASFTALPDIFGKLDHTFIALMDSAGKKVVSNSSIPFDSLSDLYDKSNLSHTLVADTLFEFHLNGKLHLGYYLKVENVGWRLFCALQPAEFSLGVGLLIFILVVAAAVTAVLMLVLYRILTHFFTRPMELLTKNIREMDTGDYSNTVPHLGNTEFGDIGTAFNNMLARIRKDRQELSLKEERHRIINEQSNSIIFEYNVDTHLMTTSPSGRMLSHFPQCMECFPDALIELNVVDAAHAAPLEKLFRDMVRGQKNGTMEIRLRTYKNELRWFNLVLSTIVEPQSHKPLRVVGKLTDIDEEKQAAEQLVFKAARDPLTHLYNKETTQLKITERITARSGDSYHALMVIDIDHFKRVNDGYGHQKGDEILKAIAAVMQNQFRPGDIVGRIGGDEFMVLLCDMPDALSVRRKVEQLLDDVRAIPLNAEKNDYMSISVGVALFPEDGASYNQLYAHADNAAYAAKNGGRNDVRFYRDEVC